MASARTEYDDSNCVFNACALNTCMARNIIRAGYGIEGNACGDMIMPMLFPTCVAAQMLAEAKKRGPLRQPGSAQSEWKHGVCSIDFGACFYAMCFPNCALAESRKRFDDSSFLLNCCCSNPVLNRSIIRTGYGLEGNCVTDILVGACLPVCAVSQVLQETATRGRIQPKAPASHQMH